ncbi:uncharacterized protein si:dkey-30e9.6 [Plectropomus leopardus]|uniref:uncharacterized protein si:dkey-30e9.6 n=1 Tax=Plectropomus leopardus TaxID=160734 RepID=UPI001C4C55BC|nr:uncharacterized protein si:dkey-30e9.6 [Plectropomus leopardus]
MVPCTWLHPLSSVCFNDKIQFSASQHLSFARSKWFVLPESESITDVWSIKPPDFSLKLYRSLSVPQQKENKKHAKLSLPQLNKTKNKAGIVLPNVLHESYQKEDPPKFITSHRPPGALETELMFVKTGKFPSGPYKNHKPHNFRPLNEDLPDIVTTYERDPGNLNLKLKHLDIIRTTRSESDFILRNTKTTMDTYKPAEPRWDAKLILPQPLWPPKSASYTRHRRRRGAYSAFLDRVEEKLSRSWKNRS